MTICNLFYVVRRRLFTSIRLWTDLLAVSSYLFNWFFIRLSAQRLNIFFSYHLSLKQLLLLTFITAHHYRPTVYPLSNHLIRWKLNVALATLIHVLADAGDHYLRCKEFVVYWRAGILWLLVFFNFTKAFLTIHRFNLSNKRLFLILFQMRTWTFLIGLLAIFVFLILKVLFQCFLNCWLIGIHLFVIIQRNLS